MGLPEASPSYSVPVGTETKHSAKSPPPPNQSEPPSKILPPPRGWPEASPSYSVPVGTEPNSSAKSAASREVATPCLSSTVSSSPEIGSEVISPNSASKSVSSSSRLTDCPNSSSGPKASSSQLPSAEISKSEFDVMLRTLPISSFCAVPAARSRSPPLSAPSSSEERKLEVIPNSSVNSESSPNSESNSKSSMEGPASASASAESLPPEKGSFDSASKASGLPEYSEETDGTPAALDKPKSPNKFSKSESPVPTAEVWAATSSKSVPRASSSACPKALPTVPSRRPPPPLPLPVSSCLRISGCLKPPFS